MGARYSAFRLCAPFTDPALGTVIQTPSAFTASVGSSLQLRKGLRLVTNIAQGFRAPNLDDTAKLGRGKGSNVFDVPNPHLQPEKTLSFDAGFKISHDRVRANVMAYYTRITALLLRRPATQNDLPYFVEGTDTLSIFRKENAGRAYTTGVEMDVEFLLASHWECFGNFSFTYGENETDDEPISGTPPAHGMVGLRWRAREFWSELHLRFAAAQERLSEEDQRDLRIPEGGTPGWTTITLRMAGKLTNNLRLKASLQNLLNRNYREHGSGFNAAGRNLIVGGDWSF